MPVKTDALYTEIPTTNCHTSSSTTQFLWFDVTDGQVKYILKDILENEYLKRLYCLSDIVISFIVLLKNKTQQ